MEQEQAGGAEKASWAAKTGVEFGKAGEKKHFDQVMSALAEGADAAYAVYHATLDKDLEVFADLLEQGEAMGENGPKISQLVHRIINEEADEQRAMEMETMFNESLRA